MRKLSPRQRAVVQEVAWQSVREAMIRFEPAVKAIYDDDLDDATARRRARQLLGEHILLSEDRPLI